MSEEKDMIPNINNDLDKPEDMTYGDYMLRPDRPLSNKHRELARMAAHGKSNKEISDALNLTQSRVCVLLTSTKIKNAIDEYRDKLFAIDADTRMKDLIPDAFNAVEAILKDTNLDSKDKENAARWVIEKVTGKPAQQVDVKSEISIGVLFDKLDNMSLKEATQRAPAQLAEGDSEPIDIAPQEEPVTLDSFDSWLDDNL